MSQETERHQRAPKRTDAHDVRRSGPGRETARVVGRRHSPDDFALATGMSPVQRALLDQGLIAARAAGARVVQRRADRDTGLDSGEVQRRAAAGVSGGGGPLPYLDTLQRAFGGHDLAGVRAHTAPDAATAIGARAYTLGENVAFRGAADLHTAAHEAAHVVQQRGGVSVPGGVGQAGDSYERHADAVADAVVAGGSAEGLLGAPSGGATAGGVQRVVQRETDKQMTQRQWNKTVISKVKELKSKFTGPQLLEAAQDAAYKQIFGKDRAAEARKVHQFPLPQEAVDAASRIDPPTQEIGPSTESCVDEAACDPDSQTCLPETCEPGSGPESEASCDPLRQSCLDVVRTPEQTALIKGYISNEIRRLRDVVNYGENQGATGDIADICKEPATYVASPGGSAAYCGPQWVMAGYSAATMPDWPTLRMQLLAADALVLAGDLESAAYQVANVGKALSAYVAGVDRFGKDYVIPAIEITESVAMVVATGPAGAVATGGLYAIHGVAKAATTSVCEAIDPKQSVNGQAFVDGLMAALGAAIGEALGKAVSDDKTLPAGKIAQIGARALAKLATEDTFKLVVKTSYEALKAGNDPAKSEQVIADLRVSAYQAVVAALTEATLETLKVPKLSDAWNRAIAKAAGEVASAIVGMVVSAAG